MSIVVVGSLHYDIVVHAPDRPRKGETVMGHKWYPKFGGKGGNQAVAAVLAGAQTRFIGAVGDDEFAAFLRATLQHHGVSTDHITTIAGHGSGMSVATLDAGGDYGAVVVSGANAMIDTKQFAAHDLWDGAQLLILQNEVPETVNIAAARAARDHGLEVCLNAAPYRALSQELTDLVDVLAVNAIEAQDMGCDQVHDLASAEAAALRLTAIVPTIVVTAGGDGVAWAARGSKARSLPAQQVSVVSTLGAGDAFIGTFCQALATQSEIADAVAVAITAAAHHISST